MVQIQFRKYLKKLLTASRNSCKWKQKLKYSGVNYMACLLNVSLIRSLSN